MAPAERRRHVVAGLATGGGQKDGMEVVELNAGDSSRASHVWRVETPAGPEVRRRAWWSTPEVSAFMLGLSQLFGTDPRDLDATARAYAFWAGLGTWRVPRVLGRTDFLGADALRVEWIGGEGGDLAQADGRELGAHVAQIHGHAGACYGDVDGRQILPLSGFYAHAWRTVQEVAARFAGANWRPHWAEAEAAFAAAPAPASAVPMLLDWNGAQFVWRAGQPHALVDVESCALAPAELDLCLWEVLLAPGQARAFREGYTSRRSLPNLQPHRAACRLILLALEVEGSPPLADWLARPALLDPRP